MLSQIEKLFPHDDLDLVSTSNGKKPHRRRSAPSQVILKNLRRVGATSDSTSKLSEHTASGDFVYRRFILESAVSLTQGVQAQERYLFLFNDILFVAKKR